MRRPPSGRQTHCRWPRRRAPPRLRCTPSRPRSRPVSALSAVRPASARATWRSSASPRSAAAPSTSASSAIERGSSAASADSGGCCRCGPSRRVLVSSASRLGPGLELGSAGGQLLGLQGEQLEALGLGRQLRPRRPAAWPVAGSRRPDSLEHHHPGLEVADLQLPQVLGGLGVVEHLERDLLRCRVGGAGGVDRLGGVVDRAAHRAAGAHRQLACDLGRHALEASLLHREPLSHAGAMPPPGTMPAARAASIRGASGSTSAWAVSRSSRAARRSRVVSRTAVAACRRLRKLGADSPVSSAGRVLATPRRSRPVRASDLRSRLASRSRR